MMVVLESMVYGSSFVIRQFGMCGKPNRRSRMMSPLDRVVTQLEFRDVIPLRGVNVTP